MADDKTTAQQTDTTQSAGGQQAATVQAQPTQEKTFTQADLDRIISDRLARESAKYADYDSLKKAKEELEAANKTELEKAIDKANKLEARQKELETQTRERVITAEAKQIAATLGFTKPEKAIKLADLSQAKYGEDGTVTGIKEALEALASEMPELLNKKGAPQTNAANPAKPNEPSGTESAKAWYDRTRGLTAPLSEWGNGGGVVYVEPSGEAADHINKKQ